MKYPSLIFGKDRGEKRIDPGVIRDLKIDLFVPEDVLSVFGIPCSKEDILMRQQTFEALTDPAALICFKALYSSSCRICDTAEQYRYARSEHERSASYLCLIFFISDFWNKASELEADGWFCGRFGDFFRAGAADQKTKAMFSNASRLYEKLTRTLRFKITFCDGSVTLYSGPDESYCSKLKSAAAALGLELDGGFKYTEETVTQDFTDAVAGYCPELFSELSGFEQTYGSFFDRDILEYRRELGFYLSMLGVFDKIRSAGIPLVYPKITDEKTVRIREAYDITLLYKNAGAIIPNDVDLDAQEPFFFLTGANGGGKTTYLRTVGTAVLLAVCGCPIPARRAEIYCIDCIYTHFPKDERFDTSGRFEEEKKRAGYISEHADGSSLVLLNETYSTTVEQTASELTASIAAEFSRRGIFGIYVTHQQGIEKAGVPYLNVTVDPENENKRTYKISKKIESKGSFAKDILRKYGLTREALAERSRKELG